MNILHMKYAVQVAKDGSINRASETLLIAQPNLSRAIKELEADLGITIFVRSAKGMELTPDGEEFIGYARAILSQIEDVERRYREGMHDKQVFSISVPRATYISEAFTSFCRMLGEEPVEVIYRETNSSRTIKNIMEDGYKLGVIRYAANYDRYFKEMLDEKGLVYELVAEFRYMLVVSRDSALAKLQHIRLSDLHPYIEIAHADPYVPSLPTAAVMKTELSEDIRRRIFVFERGSQFDLLSDNPQTFMWMSPLPNDTLERHGLVQLSCAENRKIYKDVLIHPRDYTLSRLDKCFITEMCNARRCCITQ